MKYAAKKFVRDNLAGRVVRNESTGRAVRIIEAFRPKPEQIAAATALPELLRTADLHLTEPYEGKDSTVLQGGIKRDITGGIKRDITGGN